MGTMRSSWTVVCLLAVAATLLPQEGSCQRVKRVVRMLDLINCTDVLPNYATNVAVVKMGKEVSFIKADFIINRMSTGRMKAKTDIFKCEDVDATICEYYMKVDHKDFCTTVAERDQVWTPYFNSSQPRFRCPFNKNIYRFSRMNVDTREVLRLSKSVPSLTDSYWKARTKISHVDSARTWMCFQQIIKVDYVKYDYV